MCSDLLAENTSRAAAFNTDCRRCNSALDTPASVEEQMLRRFTLLWARILMTAHWC